MSFALDLALSYNVGTHDPPPPSLPCYSATVPSTPLSLETTRSLLRVGNSLEDPICPSPGLTGWDQVNKATGEHPSEFPGCEIDSVADSKGMGGIPSLL